MSTISNIIINISLIYALLFIVCPRSTKLVTAIRPMILKEKSLASTSPDPSNYGTILKPKESYGQQHGGFGSKEVEGCLPKGVRRTSAPSRYGNYFTLGSTVCSSIKNPVNNP